MVFIAAIGILVFTSCSKSTDLYNPQPTPTNPTSQGDEIKDNVQKVFGVTFDPNQDWSSTTKKEVTINANSSIKKVQVLVYLDAVDEEGEPITDLNVLNETELNGKTSVKLTYDEPNDNKGVFVSFVSDNDIQMRKVTGSTVSLESKATTRGTIGVTETYSIPTGTPVIGKAVKSYANSESKWLLNEMLYELSDYSSQKMTAQDFSADEKETLRALILSYFVNSKKVNNKKLIDESGFFNENGYPITTQANANIIVSPIYKCDGCLKDGTGFGYEVYNSDLYYYYFDPNNADYKDSNKTVEFLQNLPKYKAIPFSEVYPKTDDDVIEKRGAYALIYWGDGTPEVGVTTGSYQFPEGLKIGFMLRSKANGKHGELYLDGRLNTNINKKSPFSSSTAYEGNGDDMPRAGWLTVNGRQLLCWESGTDADFNDLILEVQGGVSELTYTPKLSVGQIYTFCFEDTELGDYDLNDVVIKAQRINDTQVQYELYACGAFDELYVKNVDSAWENTEIHALFGKEPKTYINTEASDKKKPSTTPIIITKKVSNTFTFLDSSCQPYIYDKTTGKTIKLAAKGQDPHGIMIPIDFKYPLEKVCIKDAYPNFNNWGQNSVTYKDWYNTLVGSKVYK